MTTRTSYTPEFKRQAIELANREDVGLSWAGSKSWTVSSRDSAPVKGTTTRINAHPGDGMTATFAAL